MKKLLLFFLIFASAGVSAQTLLQENFNSLTTPIVLPTGWTSLNLSSPIGTNSWFEGSVSSFTAFEGPDNGYIAVDFDSGAGVSTLNNWLMTPPVTVQNGDEVSFYSRTTTDSLYPDRLELRQSTLGATSTNPSGLTDVGSYSTLCLTINATLVAANYPQTWTKYTYVVSGLTGQVSSRFALRYTVPNGGPAGTNSYYIGVDSFQVKRPVQNDLSLNALTVPAFISVGNFSFSGQVSNVGTNAVTSYQVTWQSNGGAVNTANITGVNIAPGASHSFTHTLPLNAILGQSYALNFSVSTVNGVQDGDATNNSLTRNTQVPTGSTTFKTLIEKFTSSTCGPCASYNNATFNPFYADQSQNFNYIAYQQNFPGTGDPYYTAESGARLAYYAINSITSLRIDGVNYSTGNNQTVITSFINSQNNKTGYFGISGARNFNGNTATVAYNITPYLSGTYNLQVVVYERLTIGNVATNGETSFKHVMMKMVPDANGTNVTLTAGTPINGTVSASLAGTNVEDITDCDVMIFLQNPVTKEVMQSFKVTAVLSTATNNLAETIKLYPNPGNDFVKISCVEKTNVTVTDVLGKTVMNLKDVTNQTSINVSGLVNGVYFFTVRNESGSQNVKFIKN